MKFLKYIFLLLLILLIPSKVLAATPEEINSFDSTIVAHKNGEIDVTETINYSFGDFEKHGIFRDIPLSSKVGDLYRNLSIHINSVTMDGSAEKYQVSRSGINEEIKIGDPNQTILGNHQYKINYTVDNEIGNFDDHDEIYWNVTGNGWSVPIIDATATIGSDFGGQVTQVKCFTGELGQTLSNCKSTSVQTSATFNLTRPLNPGEGLSIVAGFPANTFPKSTLSQNPVLPLETWKIVLLVVGAILYYLVLPVALIWWYFKARHKNRFGPVSVNFDIPKDPKGERLPPAEVGAIDNAMLEKNDVIATIFDLAIRKYIKLVDQTKDESLLGIHHKTTKHLIRKLKAADKTFTTYEEELYDSLFADGDEVDIVEMKTSFYLTFDKMRDLMFDDLVNRKLYVKDPTSQKGVFRFLAILCLFTLNFVSAFMFFWFYKVMNGRTIEGDKLDWQVDGLKLFLKNMKREYKWQADNLITVEKYIPYAIALGYINEFMEQLKIIYPNYNPSWYTGNNFYAWYPLYYGSMNSGFTTNAPSSSSGFSSGGFSGGGGGGGGGGSW